jgi:YD repeat-containing protein
MCSNNNTGCIYNDPTIRLIDVTNSGSLVAAITLGGLDGNTVNSESRDLYFTLTKGHTYRLYFPNPVSLAAGQSYRFMLRSNLQGIRSVILDTVRTTETVRVLTGGLRIRKITSSDNTGKTVVKEYKYPGYYYNSSLFNGNYSSLATQYNSYEKWEQLPPPPHDPTGTSNCPPVPVMKTYSESRALPIGAVNNNSLSYDEVEEYQSDGNNNYSGKTVYKYKIAQDILTARMPLYKIDKENERGLLLEKTIYKFSNGVFSKVKRTVNNYLNREGQLNIPADTVKFYTAVGLFHILTIDRTDGGYFPGAGCLSCPSYLKNGVYLIDKFYYTAPRYVLSTAINYDYENEDKYLTDTTFYTYLSSQHDFPSKITRTDSRKKSITTQMKYVLDYPYSSCSNTVEQTFQQQLKAIKASFYNSLVPVINKFYRVSVNVSQVTDLETFILYCNARYPDSVVDVQAAYLQLLAGFDNSTNATSQLVNNYTSGLNAYNSCSVNYYNTASDDQKAIMELQSRNIITPELERTEFVDGSLTSTNQIFYRVFQPNVIAPSRVMHSVLNNSPETRLRYLRYDSKGNLLEAARENDIKTVYFWGYGSMYPVAKVTGSDYQAASQYINQGILDNPQTTEAQMRTELNKLRINLPNAQVFTYTYIPFVGISSETDFNGRTTYYEYDPLSRLTLIRDQNLNILRKTDYQYQY